MKSSLRSYNPFFWVPCFAAWGVGGVLLATNSDANLFLAINSHNSAFADTIMPFITMMGQVEVIVPVLLMLFLWKRFRTKSYFYAAIACNVVPFVFQQVLKSLFDRDRPLALFQSDLSRVHILPEWPQLFHRSFPSGHSAGAFSFFCFLSLLLPQRYRYWGVAMFAAALLVGYSRVYLAAHFVSDVLLGSITGTLTTLFVYQILKKYGWVPESPDVNTLTSK